jgi:hypothetical protein
LHFRLGSPRPAIVAGSRQITRRFLVFPKGSAGSERCMSANSLRFKGLCIKRRDHGGPNKTPKREAQPPVVGLCSSDLLDSGLSCLRQDAFECRLLAPGARGILSTIINIHLCVHKFISANHLSRKRPAHIFWALLLVPSFTTRLGTAHAVRSFVV